MTDGSVTAGARRVVGPLLGALAAWATLAVPASAPASAGDHALPPEHQAQHAARDRAQWAGLSPAQRAQAQAERDREARAFQARADAAAGAPSEAGSWEPPFQLPVYAIHTVMLHTGKLLIWSYPPKDGNGFRPNEGRAYLVDPATGASEAVTPPDLPGIPGEDNDPAPIYCSGMSQLPDGRILVTGGNYSYANQNGYGNESPGLRTAYVFDPVAKTWTRVSDMRKGRWYPSQVLLGDGRTVVAAGYTEELPGGVFNKDIEVFKPADGEFALKESAKRRIDNYPHLFTMPDGDVLLAGPGIDDSAVLDTTKWRWSNLDRPSSKREGANAILAPGSPSGSRKVTLIGGVDSSRRNPVEARKTTESINLADADPRWEPGAPLNNRRSYANTVMLPDETLITVGGARGVNDLYGRWWVYGNGSGANPNRQVEIKEPDSSSWRLGAAQSEDRGYHSTAVLLPDGRVLSGGDERFPNSGGPDAWSPTDTAEIYSPPYLSQGHPRPTITSVDTTLDYGQEFTLATGVATVQRAVLVAPSATTHGADMTQRVVKLKKTASSPGSLTVRLARNRNVAPPGYYMLFALSDQGVPSVAEWVKVG